MQSIEEPAAAAYELKATGKVQLLAVGCQKYFRTSCLSVRILS